MGTAYEDIQLSWLRAFLAVQATGSFTAAARRVHRAQSRVSAQVAQLERHLGVQLFVRGCLPTYLTDAGEQLLPYAQSVVHEIEAATDAVTSRDGMLRGRVAIAAYPGASALVLAPVIKQFGDRYPHARVTLSDVLTHEPAASVLHSDVDFAIRATQPPITAHSLLIRPLFREPIVCVVGEGHPAARKSRTGPEVFTDASVIMTGDVASGTGQYSALLAESGARPKNEIVVGQPSTVVALVDAGLGIGVMPALAARLMDTGGRVRALRVDAAGFDRDVVLLTNRARRYPPVVERFIDELLAEPIHPALEPMTTNAVH